MYDVMMHFEGLKELFLNFLLAPLSAFDVWMSAGIISVLEVFLVQDTISSEINLLEDFGNKLGSE
jgi:hypothetical protein